MKHLPVILMIVMMTLSCYAQEKSFRIRTITAGITLNNLSDTTRILEAVKFLKNARQQYTRAGYTVQTIRIATQHLYTLLDGKSLQEILPRLKTIDRIAQENNVQMAIGYILPEDTYDKTLAPWAVQLVKETNQINFSLPISASGKGLFPNSIKAAAEIITSIAHNSPGGEGNFRFTASANVPAGTPFFPAAYHTGVASFAIGLESPNILTNVFNSSNWSNADINLRNALQQVMEPIQTLALSMENTSGWKYDGIDTSPAPGLDASIGDAIEALTGQPFGGPSTLRACALITGVLKSLPVRTCGYSGLMLPVIEDKTLARRASEGTFPVQELLLFSSVSGTGLDVIPLPGNTPTDAIERILYDVGALSMKYTNKALSARLFLIPNKTAGDQVDFENPYLTRATVMKAE